jgi:hypothetical protein
MHTERKPRTALWAIGGFAIAGLLHLGAGLYWDDSRITIMGSGALVFALVLGLATEAFRSRATEKANAGPVGIPEAAPNARKIEFDYVEQPAPQRPARTASPNLWNPAGPRPAMANGFSANAQDDELIEFQLIDEKQSPTRLVVPPAFNMESHVEAAPPMRSREMAITTGAALARRKEMVSGLPLLSTILADEPPVATMVTAPTPGKTRGQCSACGTMLWAPTQRPIRLRCPRCAHVRTLTE